MNIHMKKGLPYATAAACAVALLGSAHASTELDGTVRTSSPSTPTARTAPGSFARVVPHVPEGIGFETPSVSPASIGGEIHERLAGKTVGYAFVIAEDGQLAGQGQGGHARVPMVDGGGLPFTAHTDVNVFSVSKTLTAVAALQLMDKLGVQPDDPIADWLPPSWVPGLGFGAAGMTFFDLLTHRTGINQTIGKLADESDAFAALSPNTYAGVQAIVEHGIYPEFADVGGPGYGSYSYKNANYKLAAILIWRMALANGDISSNGELGADADSAAGYAHYVRKHVLQAAGVDGFCHPSGPAATHALAYDADQNRFPLMMTRGSGMGSFNGLYTCGPKNWWLSAMDLAAVAAHLQHGTLLSDERRAQMDDLEMGWSQASDSASRPNRYWHGGLGKWTRSNKLRLLSPQHPLNPTPGWLPSQVTTKARIRSCLMKLPGGLEATLLINSDVRGSSLSACGVLHQAFENAS